jgi:hypothetical protein
MLRNRVPDHHFRAVQLHGRKKLAVRQLGQTQCLSGDADKILNIVVPRRDIGIADRPVNRNAFP